MEKFVNSRHRGNPFISQHEAGPAALSAQAFRRQAIAANARVQPPVAKLETPPSLTRSMSGPVEQMNAVNGREGTYHEAGGLGSHGRPAERDIFDTEIEDLTESLLSDNTSSQAGHEGQQLRAYQGHEIELPLRSSQPPISDSSPAFGSQESEGTETMGQEFDVPDVDAEGRTRAIDPALLRQSNHNGGSDEAVPDDGPYRTFTPEQASRFHDAAQRGLFMVDKREKSGKARSDDHRSDEHVGEGAAASSSHRDLYDVTSPSRPSQRRQERGGSHPRNQSVPLAGSPPAPGASNPGRASVSARPNAAADGAQKASSSSSSSSSAQPSRKGSARGRRPQAPKERKLSSDNDSFEGRQPSEQDDARRANQQASSRGKGRWGGSAPKTVRAKSGNNNNNQQQGQTSSGTDRPAAPPSPSHRGEQLRAETDTKEEDMLDYPPSVLSNMSYEDLLKQPYDDDPGFKPNTVSLPASLLAQPESPSSSSSTEALSAKLTTLLTLSAAQQQTFFDGLRAAQWEDCGDWFVDQFAAMTNKMKEARREKRRAACAFEDEIAQRERLVSNKSAGFDDVLLEMRKGGRGLLGGGNLGALGGALGGGGGGGGAAQTES